MKKVGILIGLMTGGGAERVAGTLSLMLMKYYDVYVFLTDSSHITYDCGGTIINLCENGQTDKVLALFEHKKRLQLDCCISFLEEYNLLNVETRCNEIVIISEHCTPSLLYPRLQKNATWLLSRVRNEYKYADAIVVVSHGCKHDLVSHLNIPSNIIRVIYNLIDKDAVQKKSIDVIPSELDEFIGKSKLILCVGRIDKNKNQYRIIRQMEVLKKRKIDVKLLLIGHGDMTQNWKDTIESNEMNDCIKILDYCDNPWVYMRNADLLVLTSHSEGLPTVILEAMSLGLPVVSIDCMSGPRELLDDMVDYDQPIKGFYCGKRGILVEDLSTDDNLDTNCLADAIEHFLSDDEYQRETSKNELEYMSNYLNESLLDQWIDIIENTNKNDADYWKDKLMLSKIDITDKKIVIYGAGRVARRLCGVLGYKDIYIYRFVVSDKAGNDDTIMGIPVVGLEELIEEKEKLLFILGVGEMYRKEIYDYLIEHKIEERRIIPFL